MILSQTVHCVRTLFCWHIIFSSIFWYLFVNFRCDNSSPGRVAPHFIPPSFFIFFMLPNFFPLSLPLQKQFYIPSLNWWISIISVLMGWRHHLLPKMRKSCHNGKKSDDPIVTPWWLWYLSNLLLNMMSFTFVTWTGCTNYPIPTKKCQCTSMVWYYGANHNIALWHEADLHMVVPSMFDMQVLMWQLEVKRPIGNKYRIVFWWH
jgi:hypothetical protein